MQVLKSVGMVCILERKENPLCIMNVYRNLCDAFIHVL